MSKLKTSRKLRIEKSINESGKLFHKGSIPHLKEKHYFVEDVQLDGEAPKQFIWAYFYTPDSHVRKRNLKSWIPFIAKTA